MPSLWIILKSLRHAHTTRSKPGINRIVEMTSCCFKELCTYAVDSTYLPYVIIALVARLTSIPIAGTQRTKMIELKLKTPLRFEIEVHEITKAAHVDSANEPKRSAPIPAISPTLSPTLSAIVAGFLGLSSGKFCYTLPTKSEPKSAALVKMPPPTLANMAMVDPPRP